MIAHIEWLDECVGVLRVGPEFKKLGDKYVASATVYKCHEPVKIYGLTAVTGTLDYSMTRAIQECLMAQGINQVEFERMKNGVALKKRITKEIK